MKKFYYVAVQTNKGIRLVTDWNNGNRSAHWDDNGTPAKMSKSVAESIAEGLSWNCISAYILQSFFPLTEQFK